MLETLPSDVTYLDSENDSYSEVQTDDVQGENETKNEEPTGVFVAEPSSEALVVVSDVRAGSSFSSVNTDKLQNVWSVTFDGGTYEVLFPKTEDLVNVDGVLVNVGANNITGVCVGSSMDLTTYFQRTLTIAPLSGTTSQNNAYRYQSHAYMTVYSPNYQGQSLSTQVIYGNVGVNRAGRLGSTWSGVNVVIIGLLALQVLISFIGGLLRRA